MSSFNKQQLDAISPEQLLAWRRLYTQVHRSALGQLALLRASAQALKELDSHALEQTNKILGGEENTEKIFGVRNPLGCDEMTTIDVYVEKDESKTLLVRTISSEDILEATEERFDFLDQFRSPRTFMLPQEDYQT
jgi:pyruvate-formate lyase